MKKFLKPIWFLVLVVILIIVLLIIFSPMSCSNKNDVPKEHQIEKQDTMKKAISNVKVNEILLQKTIDSLQKALNACQGEKKPLAKKPITKKRMIKKIIQPRILAVPTVIVVPPNKEAELSLNGITIEKKIISQKKETPKIIAPKIVNNPVQQEPENDNCPICRTRYGKLGVKYVKN